MVILSISNKELNQVGISTRFDLHDKKRIRNLLDILQQILPFNVIPFVQFKTGGNKRIEKYRALLRIALHISAPQIRFKTQKALKII